jgi:hypothetical protein
MRARDVTFRVVLDHVSVREPGWLQPDHDFDVPISSPVELIVRGDAFEISSALSLGRVVMGLEYFFRARETSVELNRPVPRIYGWDTPPRIVVRGWQAGRKVQLTIRQNNDPLEIWNALPEPAGFPASGGSPLRHRREGTPLSVVDDARSALLADLLGLVAGCWE